MLSVLAVHAYGLLLALPLLGAIVFLSLHTTEWALAVPFAAVAVTAFILPFGLGNPHVSRLVRSICPDAAAARDGFVVQVTYQPRIRSGLRAVLEDADDIGWLRFTTEAVVFEGDATAFEIPYQNVQGIHPRNVGLRGLYVYGRRLQLKLTGVKNLDSILIAERASWILPGSRRATRALWNRALASMPPRQATANREA